MFCFISCYFNNYVACFSLTFMWSLVVRSKHLLRIMCCLVNVYYNLDVPRIVAFS